VNENRIRFADSGGRTKKTESAAGKFVGSLADVTALAEFSTIWLT
jgi:hypothetical protein